jgi:DNA-binding NtrC family response regulator
LERICNEENMQENAIAPGSTPIGRTGSDPWPVAVLVVDDEPGMLNFLGRALEGRCSGRDAVVTVESAEEAERHLGRRRFDVVIIDVSLPGKSGIEWLNELRATGYGGEVILMTAFADLDTAIEALRAGASEILKPFHLRRCWRRCGVRSSVRRCCARTSCCAASSRTARAASPA